MTIFVNPLTDPLGTRLGPPLVRGPQFENRCLTYTSINLDNAHLNYAL